MSFWGDCVPYMIKKMCEVDQGFSFRFDSSSQPTSWIDGWIDGHYAGRRSTSTNRV